MSTTTDRATASAYSGVAKDRGTVLEIAAGEVDKGASISFLSQYPGEGEILFPPMSFLAPDGPAQLEVTAHGILSVVRVRSRDSCLRNSANTASR